MINRVIKIDELEKERIIKLEKFPFTAYLEIINDLIHVSLWREIEQNNGELNNSVVFIDLFELNQRGINEAMTKLWEHAKE